MKWFKHDTDASQDSKLKKLILRHGAEGYAVYFHCLELIAMDVSETKITFELEHDAEIIADNLKIKGDSDFSATDKVGNIMRYIVSLGLFEESQGKITCLKLLKRIDMSMASNVKFRQMITNAKEQNKEKLEINHDTVMRNHDTVMRNHDTVMISHDKVMLEETRLEETRKEDIKPEEKPDKKQQKENPHKEIYDTYISIHEKLKGNKPEIVYSITSKRISTLLKQGITKEQLIHVIKQAQYDDFLVKTTDFQIQAILSDNQVAKLINTRPSYITQEVTHSKPKEYCSCGGEIKYGVCVLCRKENCTI